MLENRPVVAWLVYWHDLIRLSVVVGNGKKGHKIINKTHTHTTHISIDNLISCYMHYTRPYKGYNQFLCVFFSIYLSLPWERENLLQSKLINKNQIEMKIEYAKMLTVWLMPHINTLKIGSFARNNLTFWCLTRKCFFLIIRGIDDGPDDILCVFFF